MANRASSAIVIALMLAVAGCGSKSHAQPPIVTLPIATTSTTTPLSQVPAVIDVAYVQRVMDALDHLTGDAAREFVAQKGPTPKFEQILEAVYTGQALQDSKTSFGRAAANPDLTPISGSPQDPIIHVQRLIAATETCIVMQADADLDPLYSTPGPADGRDSILKLVPKASGSDAGRVNPSVWMIAVFGVTKGVTLGAAPCG